MSLKKKTQIFAEMERDLIVKTFSPARYLEIDIQARPVSSNNKTKYRTIRKGTKNIVIAYDSKESKEFKALALKYILSFVGKTGRKPTTKKVIGQIEVFFKKGDRRRDRDSDNWEKVPRDTLEGLIIENDSQIISLRPYIHTNQEWEGVRFHLYILDDDA